MIPRLGDLQPLVQARIRQWVDEAPEISAELRRDLERLLHVEES
jgi:hypothetical protein